MGTGPVDGNHPKNVHSFGKLLDSYVKRMNLMPRLKHRRFCEAWAQVVGEPVASESRVVGFFKGRLTIEVTSPFLMQELRGFRYREILKQMQQKPHTQDISSLAFKLAGPFLKQDLK